jgi:hypothetical protein
MNQEKEAARKLFDEKFDKQSQQLSEQERRCQDLEAQLRDANRRLGDSEAAGDEALCKARQERDALAAELEQVRSELARAQQSAAHVTLNPNYGAAAGTYFAFDVKIPHGTHGKETTKIEITVPHGVLTVKPEAVYGWDIAITERDIEPYTSHGHLVEKGPATITYTAKCTGGSASGQCAEEDHGGLDNAHLMMLAMQVKLGCDFGRNKAGAGTDDATVWQEQHTLWWNVEQWTSTPGTNDGNAGTAYKDWAETVTGTSSWGGTPNGSPSPYLYIYSSSSCTPADTTNGDAGQIGMRWGVNAEVIPPVDNMDPIKTKAQVLSMMNEETLDLNEKIEALQTDMDDKINAIQLDKNEIKHCAIIALCVACILMVAFLTLCVFRATKPKHFREYLLSAPLIDPNSEGAGKTVELGSV